MRKAIEFNIDEVIPSKAEVLEIQGMGGRPNIPARILNLLESALEIFRQMAVPKGLMADLELADFKTIYENGLNSPQNPVQLIFPKSDALALFAVTLGSLLAERASGLFAQGGPALGYMLESVTTASAERLGSLMSQRFLEYLSQENAQAGGLTVLHYSPGNCGWHLASQKAIFQFLHPEEIGISLSASFHMRPQKSLSGVLIAGQPEIHRFKPDFPLCLQCKTHKCAQRLARLQN
jgi:cobalamin-dependent methionine synthase I